MKANLNIQTTINRYVLSRRVTRFTIPGLVLVVSLLAYALNVKVFFVVAMVIVVALHAPLPRIFSSLLSRLVVAFLLVFSIIQIAATLQFIMLPHSGFRTIALLCFLLVIVMLLLSPTPPATPQRWKIVDNKDLGAVIVIAFFILPFAPIFAGQKSMEKIATIGSLQAIDATNHYAYIAEMTRSEHLNYSPGNNYPKGFHIAQGFIQNAVFKNQANLSWSSNAKLYFMDYMLWGSILAYSIFYLCISWLESSVGRLKDRYVRLQHLIVALCLGPTLSLLYLLSFVNEGFLNYYYACITVTVGVVYLAEISSSKVKNEWWKFGYLLLVFGASASWPLLTAPLLLTAVFFILPDDLRRASSVLWRRSMIPVYAVFLLQLLPIYFQLHYAGLTGTQGINAQGGLREFHPYVLLAGLVILACIVCSRKVPEAHKNMILKVFAPFFGFIALLIIFQLFTLGEVRYYVLKTSLLIEILVLVLGAATLVRVYNDNNTFKGAPLYGLLLPAIPLLAGIVLISSVANPLKQDRDLFRAFAQEASPAYMGNDDSLYVQLGEQGKIKHFNSTALHYDVAQKKFFAHMQAPFWANMMQYDATDQDSQALRCIGFIYNNQLFGTFTPPEQLKLENKVRSCVQLANNRGAVFYIITDKASAPYIRAEFGSIATIVY